MQTVAETEPRTLVITGPARDRLYERFSRLYWGRGVEVVVDRRVGERRANRGPVGEERRRGDRRRRPPDWVFPPA
jgi:hypothetical protein